MYISAVLLFLAAYLCVTAIGVLHTVFNWKVLKIGNEKDQVSCLKDVTAYAKTIPYHALYNLVVFPVFAYLHFSLNAPADFWKHVFAVAGIWAGLAIMIDWIGWIVIPHPWRCTYKDFYVDYQPWITIIYAVILISPIIAAALFVI